MADRSQLSKRNRRALTARGTLAMILLLGATLVPVAALQAQESPALGAAPAGESAIVPATRPAATMPGGGGGRSGSRSGFGGGMAPGSPQVPLAPGTGPTCALDATIYDVRLPADQIGRLDVEALTRASATPAAFEKALNAVGTAQPLYRANQSVRLAGDTISISTQTPYVTNSQMTSTGQAINSVTYRQTGAIFNLAGKANARGGADLDLNIQLATLGEGSTSITNTVKAPMFRSANMAYKGPVAANQPFVVVSVDAASVDADGKAVAYIARITMGAPQSASGGARGE